MLWRDFRIAAEPGGATALAALLAGAYRPAPGERVGILVCGGNVDLARLAALF
jgi:threonine dehydratase